MQVKIREEIYLWAWAGESDLVTEWERKRQREYNKYMLKNVVLPLLVGILLMILLLILIT